MTGLSRLALLGWLCCSLFFGYVFVLRVSPSVMIGELMRDFSVGAGLLGHLSAFYFYAYAAMQLPVGVLLDRYGARRLMTLAALLVALGCLVFALAPDIRTAYAGRLMIGFGAAFSFVGALTVTALLLPPRHFSRYGGIVQLFGMLGAIGGQAPLERGVAAFGWRDSMLALAAVGLLLALGFAMALRDGQARRSGFGELWRGLGAVCRNPRSWLAAVFGMAMTAPMLAFAGLWAVPWLGVTHGLDRTAAAAMASLLFVGWAVGSPFWGWLADRSGRRRVPMLAGAALTGLPLALAIGLPGLGTTAIALLFLAIGFGGSVMILTFAVARDANPPGASGAAMGLVNTCVVGSGAIFQPLTGLLLDLQWQGELAEGVRVYTPAAYGLALAVLPAGAGLGALAALLLPDDYRKRPARSTEEELPSRS
ncbi:MAG: MFS transporter [Thalassobaculales bacterium]